MHSTTMTTAVVGFVAILTVLVTLPSASAIQCFTCHSMDHEHCRDLKANDTASRQYLRDCNETSNIPDGATPFCRKTVLTTLIDGKTRVIRRCGYEKNSKPCYTYDDPDHAEVQCQCFEDGCNSARGLRADSMAAALLASASAAALLLLAR